MKHILTSIVLGLLLVLVLAIAGGVIWVRAANSYQVSGSVAVPVLQSPVRVVRDHQGVPYVFADSLDDAIRAQGWVTAQDRLFQIEFERYLSHGRLAELIGEPGVGSDIQVRLAGIPGHGRRHAKLLGDADRRFYELYLEGMNAYIANRRDHQFGFELLGMEPQPWTLDDMMSLLYFLNWSSAANLRAELLTQELIDRLGPEKAALLAQVTINPDDGSRYPPADGQANSAASVTIAGFERHGTPSWLEPLPRPREIGSNQWVMSGRRSSGGAPILVNDPHIDSRALPGIWHPIGIITPAFRAVGVSGPGIPGLAVGRTSHVAFGVTNAYSDVIDLFVETVDPTRPDHYLEGDASVPFEITEEVVRVRLRPGSRDFSERPLTIRRTRRGPVISDHGMDVASGKVITMRWAAPEGMAADTGAWALFTARSVDEARAAIGRTTAPWNYVVADMAGNIAHVTAGLVPLRRHGDGSAPIPVTDGQDAWDGFIPADDMPGETNPARGWIGNANHRTLPADYPHAYSTWFATSWRYRRMLELLDGSSTLDAGDHWRFMRDTRNTMAAVVAPLMAEALLADQATKPLGEILQAWNHHDDADLAAPAIFQSVYRHFALATFSDELGPELAGRYLSLWYYWQERLATMVTEDRSPWFDDTTTAAAESRDELFQRAGRAAQAELEGLLGPDPDRWQWGRVHDVTFFSPLLPGEAIAQWLGAGSHPKDGSGETINRGIYRFDRPYEATTIASLRFVADLSDPDKVLAVLSGGASGRQFDRHLHDQIEPWLNGEPRYWWFSDEAIRANAVTDLLLTP